MLSDLSSELILQVYNHLTSVSDVLNLALVSRRFNSLLPASRKLSTLFKAADCEFGPINDAIQVAVLQPQSPHLDQDPPLSFSLLRQIISLGRVARKFEKLYPELKWRENFVERRSLNNEEGYRLRRAIYRLWRYAVAFHTPAFPRTTRLLYSSHEKRTTLLRLPTEQLLEMEDVRRVLEDIIGTSIVPSNATVHDRLYDIWQNKETVHILQVRSSAFTSLFHCIEKPSYIDTRNYLDNDGWGDDITHYYVVQDLLKLDPGQIMWLKENALYRYQVESYIQGLGEWFQNNGETFSQTLQMVLLGRGHEDLLDAIDTGEFGIAVHKKREIRLC